MISVAGMHIFFALSHILFAISVSFLAFCFSFRKTKYSLSKNGFMSNFNLACLIILVSDRNLSSLFSSENPQFLFPTLCQYFLAIQCLDFSGCLLPAQCQSIFQIL